MPGDTGDLTPGGHANPRSFALAIITTKARSVSSMPVKTLTISGQVHGYLFSASGPMTSAYVSIAAVAGVTWLFAGALKAHYVAEGYSRSKKVQHKRTPSTLPLRFFGGIRLLDFCCECNLSQCVSFLVKHCVARKPLSFSRVVLVCGVADRVHLVRQG